MYIVLLVHQHHRLFSNAVAIYYILDVTYSSVLEGAHSGPRVPSSKNPHNDLNGNLTSLLQPTNTALSFIWLRPALIGQRVPDTA